ncbi:MAG: HAMP domain-containing histidine kinase [Crocinitomicaceae bacterium]|nr:HAMP domain-containing histidine kinase [Crocinitomicaceae bacterium]
MNISFRNRIALYYMGVTAFLLLIVFGIIFFVVQQVVYNNLDKQLKDEAYKHVDKITFADGKIQFLHKHEWEQTEHKEVQLNPIFLQIIDEHGEVMDKSPNLKKGSLLFEVDAKEKVMYFDTEFQGKSVREVQIPVSYNGKVEGYILSAVFLESYTLVITELRDVMLISFPIILILLFFISRFLAGRSILPIKVITQTTHEITETSLNARIPLPENKDELFDLTTAINDLMQRIEDALNREKQFTSDASHELRTPLSVLKGTLEVLIRKERSPQEYQQKIAECLKEIDDISMILENLLQLARITSKPHFTDPEIDVRETLLNLVYHKYADAIQEKEIKLEVQGEVSTFAPEYQTLMIFDNIISNAIKYTPVHGKINIAFTDTGNKIKCSISDTGLGIKKEDLDLIFQPFYRSDALEHKEIKGNGLGLSIAKKAAESISAELNIHSELGKGTTLDVILSKS